MYFIVLILVVVEDCLVLEKGFNRVEQSSVLILIVVEDGLVLQFPKLLDYNNKRLNAYCSGRWSRTTVSKIA